MNPQKSLKAIDLFAGCGGLSLGLEEAGFFPVFVNELNSDARSTYIANRLDINPLLADAKFHSADVKGMVMDKSYVKKLNQRLHSEFGIKKGEVDLLAGGPPCQGFSGIGHRRSYSVEKEQLPSNHLFQDMAVLVHRIRPRAFLFENVRGLLNAKWNEGGSNGEIWQEVFSTFKAIPGYRVRASLVFAKHYGVPQNRPRVLLVGVRDDVKSPLLSGEDSSEDDAIKSGFLPRGGTSKAPHLADILGDLVDANYENGGNTPRYPSAARTKIQRKLRTPRGADFPARKGDALTEHDYTKHSPKIVRKFEAMLRSEDGLVPEEFRTKKFAQRVLPSRWNGQGPTITATSLPDDYVHFLQPRILTVREWARLQMFPDWYQFSGKKTTGGIRRAGNPREGNFEREVPKYTQIGNAVPVGLAKAVGEHLSAVLRG
jgi:DNA (cytosine-5)-methyltransferase 1